MAEHNISQARLNGMLCGLASAIIWGAFPVVTRLGLTHAALDGYDVTAIRYTVSGLFLLPYLLRKGLRGLRWRAVALMVTGIGAPYMLVVSFGLARAPVEQFAIVTPASMIVFSTLIGIWALGDRLAPRTLAGIAVIVAGVALAGYHGLVSGQGAPEGVAFFLAGGLLWAIYTVSAKRFAGSALHATAVVSVFSMILCLPVYLAVKGTRLLEIPVRDLAVQAVYQGLLVSIGALFFYSKAVQLLGTALGATFAALVPGAAILLAAPILGELPTTTALAGLLVVTVGMIIALWQGDLPGALRRRP